MNDQIRPDAYQSLTMKEKTRLPMEDRGPQNIRIHTPMESLRVYQKEPIDPLSWAYMKLLREQSRTRRLFKENPFVEIYQLRENLFGILSVSADGAGDVWSYLDVGQDRVLLVDTGFGVGNLMAVVRELAGGRPCTVVNTHGHMDHAYGNAQFEKVYCHEYEADALSKQHSGMWNYLFDEKYPDRGIWMELSREDLIPFRPYTVLACPDGFVFSLGKDHEVELIHLGGHTPGHAAYLDRKNGWLFCGDDLVSMRVGVGGPRPGAPHPECATIPFLMKRMEILAGRIGEISAVFPGHFVTDLEPSAIPVMAEACREICRDPVAAATRIRKFPAENLTRFYREVEGLGCISYTENSFYPNGFTVPS